jgi:hypothetical protein
VPTVNNALLYVDAPPPPPRPYGIFDVALGPMPFPNPAVEGAGIIYVPDACEDDTFLIATDCPPITGTKTFSAIEAPVSGAPFAVMTSYTCGSLGFSMAEVEQRVRTRMQLREQRAVEKRIWQGSTGALGTITGLFRNATNLGSAGCPTEAVEMLEQALADNGVIGGIIHARPGMSAHLSNNYLIYEGPGVRKRTVINTPYVFGQGYDGTGPTGQATSGSTEWMYASGRILIWAGDVVVPDPRQTMDHSTNQMKVIAERMFNVVLECGVWAVEVTRTCTTSGGGT